MDVKRDELLRLVVRLSNACKLDNNVLKDTELVDALEMHGCEIVRLRKQRKEAMSSYKKSDMSLLSGTNKKKLNQQGMTEGKKSVDGIVKRRKLLVSAENNSKDLNVSRLFPSIQRQENLAKGSMTSFVHGSKITDKCHNPTTNSTTVAMAVEANDKTMKNTPKSYQDNNVLRLKSPPLEISRDRRAASPYKPMTRASSPDTVDFSASSTSTMTSFCDDLFDESSVSSEAMRRCNRLALDQTMSYESMDWAPSDDESSDKSVPFRSIANDVAPHSTVSKCVVRARVNQSSLDVTELHSESGAEEYYSAEEGEHTTESSTQRGELQQTDNNFGVINLTEAVMEVLYGIMEHNESFKWLIDPGNQARVAKLVEYHLKKKYNSDASAQASIEHVIDKLRIQANDSVHENTTVEVENARIIGSAASDGNENVNFALSEETASAQKGIPLEVEPTCQSELNGKTKLIPSQFGQRVIHITKPVRSDCEPSTVVARLKNAMMEKDREICRLNFQLSTKQKLIEEVAKKVAQQLESISPCETNANLHLDMDMNLFKSVAEKQETIHELEAALSSMEREVAGLEARVAKKSRETLLLKTKLKPMSSRLTDANVNLSRIQTENDRLVMALKEKQGKVRDLIEFLEGKEKQVMHLEKQLSLRDMQLEQALTELEKMQR
ncbi:hypothetical protein Plhal304r1_c016g0057691 [Plasmopara halstedii]